MLTPNFSLDQNDEFLIMKIKAPYAKISDAEVHFEDTDFRFYAKPYFLRLNLPGKVVENGKEKAAFDSNSGDFVIHLPKQIPGEHFERLEFLSTMLQPKGASHVPRLSEIEVDSLARSIDEDFNDWFVDQQLPTDTDECLGIEMPSYGFADLKKGVFQKLQDELSLVADLPQPDQTEVVQRRDMRIEEENSKFSAEHYLADLFDNPEAVALLTFEPSWASSGEQSASGTVTITFPAEFTEEERRKMISLGNRTYKLTRQEEERAFFALLDILLAYCYNMRSNLGEENVESSWNVQKLSATLSWLQHPASINEAVVAFLRRSLCYPLYRHWGLSTAVVEDTRRLFAAGRKWIMRALLEIHNMFQACDNRYILNELYITDYCIWWQTVSEKKHRAFVDALNAASMSKKDTGFPLMELEEWGKRVSEGKELNDVTQGMSGVKIVHESETDSDDSDDDYHLTRKSSDEDDDDDDDDDDSARGDGKDANDR